MQAQRGWLGWRGMGWEEEKLVWLLVEDDPDDAELFRWGVERCGGKVRLHSVADAPAALDYMLGRGEYGDRRQHPIPDLIILDLLLGAGSGVEFLERIRGVEGGEDLPVVVVTGTVPGDPQQDEALAFGANQLYFKPAELGGWRSLVEDIYAFALAQRSGRLLAHSTVA